MGAYEVQPPKVTINQAVGQADPTNSGPINYTVIFNMLTLKGIYGREMFETWYEMSVLLESGLDISGVITDRFDYTEYELAFAVARSCSGGKVIMNWEG